MQTTQRGNCILLLGPGVAVAPDVPDVPLTTRLARLLAGKLPPGEVITRDELAHVAQLYHQSCRDRLELEFAVQDFYGPYDGETTLLHQELSNLPSTLCVNTSFDSFLRNAFLTAGKAPIYDYYHFQRPHDSALRDTDPHHPIVYDLYGNRGEGDSLVLTENDLLDFLVNVIKGTPPLPPFITARFSDPNTSFLFLGFGFRHWYVRILLHVLRTYGHRSRSLALEDACFFTQPEQRQNIVFFERVHCIEFRQQSWADFATALRQRYEASVGDKARVMPAPPADPPKVFLCHSHQDRDAVARLADRLQALGIAVWLDKQNLRGGDNWERQIPHVIEKQVDYVLVLHSSHMLEKVESYFHKEINAALERQQGFAEGFRFVIPVQLERGAVLDKLSHLHSLELMAPQGVQELAQAIQEDWNRRGRQRAP